MIAPELATSLLAGLIGLGLGVALMAWDVYRAEKAGARPALWTRLLNTLDRIGCDETVVETLTRQAKLITKVDAQNRSLQATINDQANEVSRLTGEKHARDQVIHEIAEKAASLHRQEVGE